MEINQSFADEFEKNGFFVFENFVDDVLVKNIVAELEELYRQDAFKKAGIGKSADFRVDTSQRGDFILWIDRQHIQPSTSLFLEKIDQLMLHLNRSFYLGINDYECHYAIYPKGTFYRRHSDRHKASSSRIVSFVFYLNANWNAQDGGQLRIYNDDNTQTDILPSAGKLAIFLSEKEHEVMMTNRERMSVTGWMMGR